MFLFETLFNLGDFTTFEIRISGNEKSGINFAALRLRKSSYVTSDPFSSRKFQLSSFRYLHSVVRPMPSLLAASVWLPPHWDSTTFMISLVISFKDLS